MLGGFSRVRIGNHWGVIAEVHLFSFSQTFLSPSPRARYSLTTLEARVNYFRAGVRVQMSHTSVTQTCTMAMFTFFRFFTIACFSLSVQNQCRGDRSNYCKAAIRLNWCSSEQWGKICCETCKRDTLKKKAPLSGQ